MAAIFKPKMVSATTSKLCFDFTIIFLGHNNEGIPAQTIYLPCSVWEKLTNLHSGWQPYWITRWPPPKLLISSIHFHTAKNVGIATKIEFLYCFACEILSKQLLEVSILRTKMADQKVFRTNGNIGFRFQRGISFPKMYLVTTLHKIRAKIHSNPDYLFTSTLDASQDGGGTVIPCICTIGSRL